MDILTVLDKHYRAFRDTPILFNFLIGFNDYLKYIHTIPQLKNGVEDVIKEIDTELNSIPSPIAKAYRIITKSWKTPDPECFEQISDMFIKDFRIIESYLINEHPDYVDFEMRILLPSFDQFHNKILAKHVSRTDKTRITIQKDGLICPINEPSMSYKLGSSDKRFKLILSLFKAPDGLTGNDLASITNIGDSKQVSKEVKQINKNFRGKINNDADLITSTQLGKSKNYTLNKDSFTFKLI